MLGVIGTLMATSIALLMATAQQSTTRPAKPPAKQQAPSAPAMSLPSKLEPLHGTCASNTDCPDGQQCYRPDTSSKWACMVVGKQKARK